MARTFEVNIPHSLPVPEAKNRIDRGLSELAAVFASRARVEAEWSAHVLNVTVLVMSQRASGAVVVRETNISVQGRVPMLLSPFVQTIEAEIAARAPAIFSTSAQSLQIKGAGSKRRHGFLRRILLYWF